MSLLPPTAKSGRLRNCAPTLLLEKAAAFSPAMADISLRTLSVFQRLQNNYFVAFVMFNNRSAPNYRPFRIKLPPF